MTATGGAEQETPARRPRTREERERARRHRQLVRRRRLVALGVLLGLVALAVLLGGSRLAAPSLEARGPAKKTIGPSDLGGLAFAVATDDPRRVRWQLDGAGVQATTVSATGSTLRPRKLAEGRHEVRASVDSSFPFASRSREWTFTVDTTPPALDAGGTRLEARKGEPLTLAGTVEDGAELTVNGVRRQVEDGKFSVRFETAPASVSIAARDAAGNVTRQKLAVTLVPRRPEEPMRGVHVTALAWANDELRGRVLDLVESGAINTVELDLKDESGVVGYDSQVPLARRAGAGEGIYDLAAAVKLIHSKGARVVGRLVAFRDPVLARWAWQHGERDQVVQTPEGDAYAGYGGYTNFASLAVQQYNIDVAKEAAAAGVDDILYDYVRRPDGPLATMVFPGLEGKPDRAIAAFLRRTRAELPRETYLGACVFGIAATRPDEIAQNVPRIAAEVDYVAPMLYPSHWGPYEYDLPNPDVEPYEIVRRSLVDFEQAVAGKGARIVPWLQDFSLKSDYGAAEVQAQIEGARDAGIDEWLLWDPEVTYTAAALQG